MINPGTLPRPWRILIGGTFNPVLTMNSGVIGNLVDLTSYTAKMQIRPFVGSSDIIVELTTENGGITINGPAGTISLLLTPEQTALLAPIRAGFDLQLTAPGGEVDYVLQGAIIIQQMYTT